MLVFYSKQYSPVFKRSRHCEYRPESNQGPGDINFSGLEIIVREPNCKTLSIKTKRRPTSSPNMDKYLPRLNSSETRNRSNDVKRNCNVHMIGKSSPSPSSKTVHLPGIGVPTPRKSSISDSTNTTNTSSIPSIEISEPEAEEEDELLVPFQGDRFFKTSSQNPFKKSKRNCDPDTTAMLIGAIPRPPTSPRPPERNVPFTGNTKSFRNNRRNFKRSQHFELTLQNIEEVKDLENDSPDFVKLNGTTSITTSLTEEREREQCHVDHPRGMERILTGRRKSHPIVDYRELRKTIDATRLVSMGDMSIEFTRHYLAGKGNEQEDSDEDIRERCISWLNSLNSS